MTAAFFKKFREQRLRRFAFGHFCAAGCALRQAGARIVIVEAQHVRVTGSQAADGIRDFLFVCQGNAQEIALDIRLSRH